MRDLLLGSGLAAADQQSHVYQLKHAKAEDVAKAIADFLNAGGGGSSVDGSLPISSGTPGGQKVVAEKTTNSLLVRGTSEELATIQRLISELDRSPREVMVQALLVEVELGDVNEFGLELGFQDSVLFDRSVVDKLVTINQTNTAPNGTQTTNQAIISQTAAPGFNFNNQPLGNNTAARPSRIGTQALSNLGVSRVNGDLGFGGLVLSAGSESVNVLLRALDANFNIEVLSRPVVRSLENKEALIQIGQQVPIVDGVTLTPVGSANPSIRQDKAGIILKVTPRISPDARVQLDVQAEKSAFNLTPGSGVPIFTDATNGNVIEAPIKDLTTAQTTVSIQSGHTIVLGGMITNDQTVFVRKLPWLGDLPLIGRLFRYDFNRLKRKELLVFLTPIVIDNDEHAERLKGAEINKVRLPAEAWNLQDGLTLPAEDFSDYPMTAAGRAVFKSRLSAGRC
jgi:type II secretory pathway component GspD/PulD (secretin)